MLIPRSKAPNTATGVWHLCTTPLTTGAKLSGRGGWIHFIEANIDAPIGLPDIVAASGIPGRTLLKHFRDFRGTSPMRYLRRARFRRVHEALRRASPEERVMDIAAAHGFTHMGRFSVEYRRQFGETPSETLDRNGRRSAGPYSAR